jgi:6-phosphogluconolactonase
MRNSKSPSRFAIAHRVGSGEPNHTFHPKGRQVYVINELANSVAMFDHDPETDFLIER